jgi:hypothetical protein
MIGAIIIGVVVAIFWIWGVIDIIRRDNGEFTAFKGDNVKIVWIIIVLVAPVVGTIIYMLLEKRLFLKDR